MHIFEHEDFPKAARKAMNFWKDSVWNAHLEGNRRQGHVPDSLSSLSRLITTGPNKPNGDSTRLAKNLAGLKFEQTLLIAYHLDIDISDLFPNRVIWLCLVWQYLESATSHEEIAEKVIEYWIDSDLLDQSERTLIVENARIMMGESSKYFKEEQAENFQSDVLHLCFLEDQLKALARDQSVTDGTNPSDSLTEYFLDTSPKEGLFAGLNLNVSDEEFEELSTKRYYLQSPPTIATSEGIANIQLLIDELKTQDPEDPVIALDIMTTIDLLKSSMRLQYTAIHKTNEMLQNLLKFLEIEN